MTGLGEQLKALARLSLEDPRAGIRALLALGVPLPARSLGLLLTAVASAFMMHLGFLILPPGDDPMAQFIAESPLRTAVIQWVFLAASVLLIFRIGQAWGGRGSLQDTLLVMVWLQLIMLGVQILQLVVLLISPPVAGILNLLGLGLFFWLMTSFIAELHGFQSRGAVLAGILVAGFGVALLIVVLLMLIFGPEAIANV